MEKYQILFYLGEKLYKINRCYFHEIIKKLDQKQSVIIAGPRQSGKTTTLKQLQDYFSKNGNSCTYIDLENPQIRLDINDHPDNLLHYRRESL